MARLSSALRRLLPQTPFAFEALAVLSVVLVVLWQLHPALLFSGGVITGGDTAAHFGLASYLSHHATFLDPTPWYPGWFAGMPSYTFYFPLTDLLAGVFSPLWGFVVSFKLATALGSLLMPLAACWMGRLFRAPRLVVIGLTMATLPFLFNASYTIDGGNLFSTLAGEYAFSLALALALVTIGFFARISEGRRRVTLPAVFLSLTLVTHALPWFYALLGIAITLVIDTVSKQSTTTSRFRRWRYALAAGLLSAALSAWWALPFASEQSMTNSMGYVNDNVASLHAVFTQLGWFNADGSAAGPRWVIVLAGLGLLVAFFVRDRLGMVLGSLTLASLVAYIFDPQSAIWNERLIPFWYISIYLLTGWLVGYVATHLRVRPRSQAQDSEWPTPRPAPSRRRMVAVLLLGLLSTLPGLVFPVAIAMGLATGGNQVTYWSAWNYSGAQAKGPWLEYHDLMTTMDRVGHTYGCGRAMWEYNSDQNRFGSPMALMLLPYWTNNCVDSMEGLLFESSATTPYHFINQAELSASPSEAQVGLSYGPLDIAQGIKHLQMLGVRYFIAETPSVTALANANPSLTLVATTHHWPRPGATWSVYLIHDSAAVAPLSYLPNVVSNVSSRTAWLVTNEDWYLNPSDWSTPLVASGPSSWPHITPTQNPRAVHVTPTAVSHIRVTATTISFDVSRLGVPVVVKTSYFPGWTASGATGPFRSSPNLMVVVPTSHHVELSYGPSPASRTGLIISYATIASLLVAAWWRRRRAAADVVEIGDVTQSTDVDDYLALPESGASD